MAGPVPRLSGLAKVVVVITADSHWMQTGIALTHDFTLSFWRCAQPAITSGTCDGLIWPPGKYFFAAGVTARSELSDSLGCFLPLQIKPDTRGLVPAISLTMARPRSHMRDARRKSLPGLDPGPGMTRREGYSGRQRINP